jgi:transcriptional regulatory protein RtcR
VYAALHEFAKGYTFRDDTDYYVHLTTRMHVAQICLFLLTEARYLPARIIETFMPKKDSNVAVWGGRLDVIDLNLSNYDQLAKRFMKESLDSQDLLKGGISSWGRIARVLEVAINARGARRQPSRVIGGHGQCGVIVQRVHQRVCARLQGGEVP